MTVTVATGLTSGLGAEALRLLATEPGARVVVGARRLDAEVPVGVELVQLDLSSLASVRTFAEAVRERLDGTPIDRLVLNAGLNAGRTDERTVDGYGVTFATNHLAHHLLLRLLVDDVARDGRVVITTSDTHDPAVVGVGPTRLDIETWVFGPSTAMGTYAASKLGNLLDAEYLAASDRVQEKGIRVIAFNPGLTGGTGLMRELPGPVQALTPLVHRVLGLVSRVRPAFYVNDPQTAGTALAGLADGSITPPPGRLYGSMVRGELTWPDPSALAQDPQAVEQMWRRSDELVGLG